MQISLSIKTNERSSYGIVVHVNPDPAGANPGGAAQSAQNEKVHAPQSAPSASALVSAVPKVAAAPAAGARHLPEAVCTSAPTAFAAKAVSCGRPPDRIGGHQSHKGRGNVPVAGTNRTRGEGMYP
eukprot:297264-Pyramimonas_sp.AAC.2